MPQDVVVYGVFLCSVCSQPLRNFTSSPGVRTLKCQNPDCANYNVAYNPPTITITEAS